jgi:uncharacterized protein (DUF2267 family)
VSAPYAESTTLQEFVQRVQSMADLANYDEAEQVARATLSTLGETVSGGEAKQLGSWLPPELQSELAEKHGQASSFDKRQFLDKVAGKIYTVDLDRAEVQVSAVLQVLRSAAPANEINDTIAQLPQQLAAMFE